MAYLMIVDDDDQLTSAMTAVLSRAGHEVVCQPDPDVVMEQIQRRHPDLMVLDVMFPEDDFGGMELARAIGAVNGLRSMPILMLTSINARHDLGLDRRDTDNSFLPVTDFMDKPVDLEELVGKVNALLAAGPRA